MAAAVLGDRRAPTGPATAADGRGVRSPRVVVPAAAGLLALAPARTSMSPSVSGTFSPRLRAPSRCRKAMSRPPRSCASKGPMAKPKARMAASISAIGAPWREQILGRRAVALQDAVADEAVADAGAHRDLAEPAPRARSRSPGSRARSRGGHDLEELHHVGRAEEVQADEASGGRGSPSAMRGDRGRRCWSPGPRRAGRPRRAPRRPRA